MQITFRNSCLSSALLWKTSQLKLPIYGYKISNWPRRHVPDIKQNYKAHKTRMAHTHTWTINKLQLVDIWDTRYVRTYVRLCIWHIHRWSRSQFIARIQGAAKCNSYFTKAKNVSLPAHKTFYLEKPKLTLMLTLSHNSSVPPPVPQPPCPTIVHIICHLHGLHTQRTWSADRPPENTRHAKKFHGAHWNNYR